VKLKFEADVSVNREEIFPFAVPHFRLPLLPSSRNGLVKVSQVLTKCRMLPWQLQSLTEAEHKRKQDVKTLVNTQEQKIGDIKDIKSSSQECDRETLQFLSQ